MLTVLSILSYLLIFVLLAALAYRDMKEYILPDYLNAALALTFMSFHISVNWQLMPPPQALLGAAMGGGLLLLIRFAAMKFYHPDSVGLGDVKLVTAAGLGLGPDILLALVVGSFIGLFHGLFMAYTAKTVHKRKLPLSQVNVPAGVGLAAGIALIMVYRFGFEWLQ